MLKNNIHNLVDKIKNNFKRIQLFKNWYTVVLPATRLINRTDRIMKLRNGVLLYVRNIFSSDFAIIFEIFYRDDYYLKSLSLPQKAVVIDVGGNIGIFALAVAHYFPQAKIISFEPYSENFAILQKNVKLNNCVNITAVNKGISNADGEANLFIHEKNLGSHSLLPRLNSGSSQKIQITSLETAFKEHSIDQVDLLKMDIEGGEYAALLFTPPEILNKIKRMVLELHDHPTYSQNDLINFLKKNGFLVKKQDESPDTNVFIATRP